MSACGCHDGSARHESGRTIDRLVTASLVVSGSLIAVGLALGLGSRVPEPVRIVLFAGAVAAGGWMLVPSAWSALRRLRPNISLLMVAACAGAVVIGEWAEAAVVVFLFGVAEWLEGWADRRSHRAVRALLELAPEVATVLRDGRAIEVPADSVTAGETLVVKSGMTIALDGEVVAGRSSVDQAPITGESLPVPKERGDAVFAGSINLEGALEVRVTKPAGDTMLAKIIRLVREAQEQKAPTQRFVDGFARYYTPSVAAGALLVFLVPPLLGAGDWTTWLYRACALLIIACPCALVIATPVGIVAGLTALARGGVLVKGGAHLETAARLRALAVDKTGTITEGRPRVLEVLPGENVTESEIVGIAAALEEHSTHPFAHAVIARARAGGLPFGRADGFRAHDGRGAEGTIDGHRYFVGNHRFTHELGVCSEDLERRLDAIEARGHSVAVVGHMPHDACQGQVMGVLSLGDSVRPDAAHAIRALRDAGLDTVVMLSGDNLRTARAIAAQVGIEDVRAGLLPEDKVAAVRELRAKHGVVGMVGDGINDAPALAMADLGIAMGAAGSDTAIETADVALMKDDLSKVAVMVHTSRRTMAIIRFNIAFALALKALFLVLAVSGHTSLWLAILADTGATLLVVANALRLLRPMPSTA